MTGVSGRFCFLLFFFFLSLSPLRPFFRRARAVPRSVRQCSFFGPDTEPGARKKDEKREKKKKNTRGKKKKEKKGTRKKTALAPTIFLTLLFAAGDAAQEAHVRVVAGRKQQRTLADRDGHGGEPRMGRGVARQ